MEQWANHFSKYQGMGVRHGLESGRYSTRTNYEPGVLKNIKINAMCCKNEITDYLKQ